MYLADMFASCKCMLSGLPYGAETCLRQALYVFLLIRDRLPAVNISDADGLWCLDVNEPELEDVLI